TPAPADATPIEIAAAPVSVSGRAGMTTVTRAPDQPRYADLINPDHVAREQRCLAEAVYFEARSEPEQGQAAVAQVVLNRVKSGLYPTTICGVVYQNRHRHLACQFTFACEGKGLRVSDNESWERARRVAREVLEGRTYLADVGGATHYHADYVRPSWSRRLKKMDVIGRHIFYKLKPGQT
ncbi:MAG TPA: cell wall hydrolase, partial [Beijerinckiaceae bacterium]|nr:cell wall hydrolase [Beijerinckiaceae bacterium]